MVGRNEKKESGGLFGLGGSKGDQAKDVARGTYKSSMTGVAHPLDNFISN